ncbi:uncharacterized protein FIBRA_04295 [Fibroporia radiculosa]|uniref:C3H1-type domain-containing protein n=1 Tax=Fibroporia radiculosa TaxID=599839 RepID=J4GP11_9APHY|nr:uncharacterized protein FIBRA_04295 [Fibroporia radiculosa]CCM02215.1 predicted protein [Fibroporia radiculosa]
MLFDPETAGDLKPWLVRNLEPICDAEPGALADYILALLKHNAPEADLRKELGAQLDEFLEKEGPSFLNTLFTALRTKSYLPYSAASPPAGNASGTLSTDTGIPIPLDALLSPSVPTTPERGRKRSHDHDERDFLPTKGPRLNHEGQFSRYGRHDNRSSWGGRGERGSRMAIAGRADYMDGGMNSSIGVGAGGGTMGPSNPRGIPAYQDRGRGVCRDYFNNGYCARGAFCKYSHGEDAIVPSQLFPMNGGMSVGSMPFVPMMPNGGMAMGMAGGSNAAYDPHERMDMRPNQGPNPNTIHRPPNSRGPAISRQDDSNNGAAQHPGELPVVRDLTPQVPREESVSRHMGQDGYGEPRIPDVPGPSRGSDIVMGGMNGATQDMDMNGPPAYSSNRGPYRGGRPGGGRGTFGGEVQSFRPEKRNDKTLVVEKIPEDKLSLGSVNEWFKRFGTVTNVAVDAMNAKALVSFSNHDEALAAWRSEDAVFGNRFVKVFWHRPLEGHGQVGQRMLAASAPLVANISIKDSASPATTTSADSSVSQPVGAASTHVRKTSTTLAAAALAAKQKLLEQQIAEQKSLMAQLSSASPPEKKGIMARLRKLGEEMKPSASASTSQPTPSPATTSASAQAKRPAGATPRPEDKERIERERLDKELELHHAVGAVDGEEEGTEELKATLAKLKAEAASLGITEIAEGQYVGPSVYRPPRGRGRGRGGRVPFRGAMRGGPPRGSMKLDLRPKKLLVKSVGDNAVQAVRDWYETTGQVESVDATDTGDVIVAFKSRAAAEQGLAKGTNIPIVGQVQISWFNVQQPSAVAHKTPTSVTVPEKSSVVDKPMMGYRPPSPDESDDRHMHEETANGWGGDDAEDGFGML